MANLVDFLFIPVSSLIGVGEYTRSLIIAQELQCKAPNARIAFVLNENSPVVAQCPFPVFTVGDTPTKCSSGVNAIILMQSPRVVIFDASGRVGQLKTAKKIKAKTVFISQHAAKRKKGMQLRRAIYTDVHYVVQPNFALPPFSVYQQLKFRLISKPLPVCVGPVFKVPGPQFVDKTLETFGFCKNEFILINAGSGGHKIGSELASDIFLAAAELISDRTGLACLVIMGANYPKSLPSSTRCKIFDCLAVNDFAALLLASRFSVLSGGSGFLQAYLLNKPVVVTAVSSDQAQRIEACSKMGFGTPCEPKAQAIAHAALKLIAGKIGSEGKNPTGQDLGGLTYIVNGLVCMLHGDLYGQT